MIYQEISLPFDLELPPSKIINTGLLTCLYERGNLRYINAGKTELIRMIYGAVRDEFWGTVPYTISNEKITTDNDENTCIRYTAHYGENKVVYKADFAIDINTDNTIVFKMNGIALADFKKNRIGLCVLEPIETCCGRSVKIKHDDGKEYTGVFPETISPHQPFKNIREMVWDTKDGINIQLIFSGDIFETEDQRNWADNSFKTYATPLALPFPAEVFKGGTMEQVIVVKIAEAASPTPIYNEKGYREEKIPFPKIGYNRSGNQLPWNDAATNLFSAIPFDHYRIALYMDNHDWAVCLRAAVYEAMQLHAKLRLTITFTKNVDAELKLLCIELEEKQEVTDSILVLQQACVVPTSGLYITAYKYLKKQFPKIKIGYGTDGNFVEVNRQPPLNVEFDFIGFSINPQVHATDTRSVIENLQSLPYIVSSAYDISNGKPVYISPVTLKDRSSTVADERQYSSAIAYWTAVAIQQLSTAGSIVFYELFGDAGLVKIAGDNVVVQSPVYKMLEAIHYFKPVIVIKRFRNNELLSDGLLLENAAGKRLLFKSDFNTL